MKPSDNDKIKVKLSKIGRSFKPKADFEKWCRENPQAVNALKSHAEKTQTETRTQFWSIIMKSPITKLAAAAVIIFIVVLGINLSARPAWAIEQTIKALEHIKTVYISGYATYPDSDRVPFELWARPSREDGFYSGDFKLVEGDEHISVSSEEKNLTYVYSQYATGSVVYITEGLNRSNGPYPTSDLFRQFKELAENWKEEYYKDEITGRDCVFVTFTGIPVNEARYWKFVFDLETKLPVRGSVWLDANYQGQPHYEYENIIFDKELPDGFFEFEIPQDTQVIDCRILRNLLDENPYYGIAVDRLSTFDACREAVSQYWQAVINKDWSIVKNLRPLSAGGEDWDRLLALYNENEPIQLINITGMNHLNDPGTFAEVSYEILLKNGEIKKGTFNVEVKQTITGKIAVIAGSIGPEFNDK